MFFKEIASKFFKRAAKHTSCEDAAGIIKRFTLGGGKNPYEWDDFESITEDNPDVNLAIHLCWHYAGKYPARRPTEYCGQEAREYFLGIAYALENKLFSNLDHMGILRELKMGQMPESLGQLLDECRKRAETTS